MSSAQVRAKRERLIQSTWVKFPAVFLIQSGASRIDKTAQEDAARVPPRREAIITAGKNVMKGMLVPMKRKITARVNAAMRAAANPMLKTRIRSLVRSVTVAKLTSD
jgi:hypothetical protein